MKQIDYIAIFFDEETTKKLINMQKEDLPKKPLNMHVTFKYRPSDEEIRKFSTILGEEFEIKIIGYASDGKNSGYEVQIDPEIEELYTNNHTETVSGIPKVVKTTPHITVSMSEDAKAVDTGLLEFEEIDKSFIVKGKAGQFIIDKENNKKEISFDSINISKSEKKINLIVNKK